METNLNASFVTCICNFVFLLLITKAEDADANARVPEN
jgi:hypothetical protein